MCAQRWNDYRLTWNTSEYDGLRFVYLSPIEMWTPDVKLANKYNK